MLVPNPYNATVVASDEVQDSINSEQQTTGSIMRQENKIIVMVGTMIPIPWLISAGYIAVNKEEYIAATVVALAGIIHGLMVATIPMITAAGKLIQLQINEARTDMKNLEGNLEKMT